MRAITQEALVAGLLVMDVAPFLFLFGTIDEPPLSRGFTFELWDEAWDLSPPPLT